MSSKPNYKARVNRANRNNVPVYSVFESFKKIKFFALFLIIIFPIYPSLAAIGNASVTAIGDYNESSILASFFDTEGLSYISDTGLVTGDEINSNSGVTTNSEEFESDNSNQEIPKSDIRTYTVVEYDDIIKISKKYDISAEVILWSNNLSMNDTLKVGQVLKIPAKSGIVHILKRGETASSLAKQYNVSVAEILEYNNISDATKIKDGTKLMIPGAVIKEVIPPPAPVKKTETPKTQTTTNTRSADVVPATTPAKAPTVVEKAATAVESNNGLKDRYEIKFTGLGRGFVAGNCTWHVARNKTVTWRGNANQWIKNARAKGIPTGKTPIVGAIVQFSGYGYNSYYGHVGIVTDVTDTHIIVSDMNYAGLYKVTIRQVAKNDPAIDGYIYVD